jgi:hypothetical protein
MSNCSGSNLFEFAAYLQHAQNVRFEALSKRAALQKKWQLSHERTKRAASAVMNR